MISIDSIMIANLYLFEIMYAFMLVNILYKRIKTFSFTTPFFRRISVFTG